MRFSWDEQKNAANKKNHGVSFEEASELFLSEGYLEIFDEAHSLDEDRFIAVGPIKRGLVLVVYTERDLETVRIVSARWATKREAGMYQDYLGGK